MLTTSQVNFEQALYRGIHRNAKPYYKMAIFRMDRPQSAIDYLGDESPVTGTEIAAYAAFFATQGGHLRAHTEAGPEEWSRGLFIVIPTGPFPDFHAESIAKDKTSWHQVYIRYPSIDDPRYNEMTDEPVDVEGVEWDYQKGAVLVRVSRSPLMR